MTTRKDSKTKKTPVSIGKSKNGSTVVVLHPSRPSTKRGAR